MKTVMTIIPALALMASVSACMDIPPIPIDVAKGDYGVASRYVADLMDRNMSKNKIKGVSIVLIDDQKIVWSSGFGNADDEAGIPAKPETVYGAGTATQVITAAAVMQLHEKGLVDLDKPYTDYVPEFSIKTRFPDAPPFTVRDILTHHSGMPSEWFHGDFTKKPETIQSLFPMLAGTYMAYPPGTLFSPSNLAYSLLGALIKKVSGMEYEDYVGLNILKPLGMNSSTFSKYGKKIPSMAVAYKVGKPKVEYPTRDVAAQGLYTSVLDMAKFMQVFFSGGANILSPKSAAEMLKQQNERAPMDMSIRMGLGWKVYDPADLGYAGKVAFIDGASVYYRMTMIMLPDHKIGAIALSSTPTAKLILDYACFEAVKIMLQAKTGIRQPKQTAPAREVDNPPSKKDLAGIAGLYATSIGAMAVNARDGYLETDVSKATIRMHPLQGGGFRPEVRVLGLFPVTIKQLDLVVLSFDKVVFDRVSGHQALILKLPDASYLLGTRIHRVPISKAWSDRAGKYSLVNRGDNQFYIDDLRIFMDNGYLFMEFLIPEIGKEKSKFALDPVSDTESVAAGFGRYLGETISVIKVDGSEALTYSGYIFKRN